MLGTGAISIRQGKKKKEQDENSSKKKEWER